MVKAVYKASQQKPFCQDFGLKDQLQRSAVSIMANIAEGYHSFSKKETALFLGYAVRSCAEVLSHLYIALDVGYLTQTDFETLQLHTQKSHNFVRAYLRYLNEN